MIEKRLLVPDRVRRPPREGFSWVDRRFLHEYAARLSGDAVFLYLFLAAVSDQHGLSFYVETLVLQERRRRELPSPTPLRPKRQELIDEIQLDEPDPAAYDRLCQEPPNSPELAPPDERRPIDDLPSEPF
ncbi:MAG: hypothetical protein GX575_27520 [Candidatus Anammoximicrobium sp.]|nr:hypothetical protein [Candidatus Anammoximicrobium sp.]